ncbi:hypothetical protein CALCODRAFT_507807 [Calocera cornea HHB12733]|uniref:Uncharacterized protein n=1 Tax=Calocera cornea HHB12733 TaxID=1353952 RepID=A0A165H837_9BASI|nr:hypothetical protein CALCODRAFT_507807 [Calocera cornea HHB12733]
MTRQIRGALGGTRLLPLWYQLHQWWLTWYGEVDSHDGSGTELELYELYNGVQRAEREEEPTRDGAVEQVKHNSLEGQIEAMARCFHTSANFLKRKSRGTRHGQVSKGLWEAVSSSYQPIKPMQQWRSLFKKYEARQRASGASHKYKIKQSAIGN